MNACVPTRTMAALQGRQLQLHGRVVGKQKLSVKSNVRKNGGRQNLSGKSNVRKNGGRHQLGVRRQPRKQQPNADWRCPPRWCTVK